MVLPTLQIYLLIEIKRTLNIDTGYNFATSLETNDDEETKRALAPSRLGIVTGHVYGQLQWTDDYGDIHPLVGAKLQMTMINSWWNSTTYTNENGEYSFDYNNIWYAFWSYEPTLHIYLEGESVSVAPVNNSTYHKEISLSMSNNDNVEYCEVFQPTDILVNLYAFFRQAYIFQTMLRH